MIIDAQNGKFRMEREIEFAGGGAPGAVRLANDGQIETMLVPDSLLGTVDSKVNVSFEQETPILSMLLLGPPKRGGLGLSDASLEGYLQNGRLLPEWEEVNGRPCVVLEAVHDEQPYAKLWLDPERNCLPMRRISFGRTGEEVSRVEAEEVAQFSSSDGAVYWLPTRMRTFAVVRGVQVESVLHVDPQSVALNEPVAADEFRLKFPPGATIADRVAGVTYTIDSSGEKVMVVTEQPPESDDRDAQTRPNSVENPPHPTAAETPSSCETTHEQPAAAPIVPIRDSPGRKQPAAADDMENGPESAASAPGRASSSRSTQVESRSEEPPAGPPPPVKTRTESAATPVLIVAIGALAVVLALLALWTATRASRPTGR
ncbi:MAG: hypothetical protein HZB38_00375 [Planctomycetes bacterium]|nr:hypothetical protein [Planctomycetota bacterium]